MSRLSLRRFWSRSLSPSSGALSSSPAHFFSQEETDPSIPSSSSSPSSSSACCSSSSTTLDEVLSKLTVMQFSAIPLTDSMRMILPLLLQAVAYTEGFGDVTSILTNKHDADARSFNHVRNRLESLELRNTALNARRHSEAVLYGTVHKMPAVGSDGLDAWRQWAGNRAVKISSEVVVTTTIQQLQQQKQQEATDVRNPSIPLVHVAARRAPKVGVMTGPPHKEEVVSAPLLAATVTSNKVQNDELLPKCDGIQSSLHSAVPIEEEKKEDAVDPHDRSSLSSSSMNLKTDAGAAPDRTAVMIASSLPTTAVAANSPSVTAALLQPSLPSAVQQSHLRTPAKGETKTQQQKSFAESLWKSEDLIVQLRQFEQSLQQGMYWHPKEVERLARQWTDTSKKGLPLGLQRLLRAEFGPRGGVFTRHSQPYNLLPSQLTTIPPAGGVVIVSPCKPEKALKGSRLQARKKREA